MTPSSIAIEWARRLSMIACLATLCGVVDAEDQTAYPLLRESIDPEFYRALKAQVTEEFKETRKLQVQNKKVSIAVVDISDPMHPRVAAENGDVMLYAASLPKIAILLGAYAQAEQGALDIDEELRESLTRMIRKSSNRDATAVLNRVGFEELAEILQSERYRLYDPEHGGGLWVGRDFSGGKVWRRDPLNNISHGASAMQVARFYYLLVTNRLTTPQYSQEMLEILSNPGIRHKFVKGLEQANPEAKIARKSGTWRNFHADGAVVESDHGRYIIAVIGEHPEGGRDLERVIKAVERAFQNSAVGRK
jgi:beta-lactamase class A